MNFHADDFDIHDLMSFANEWVALGSGIQEQVEYIMNVEPEAQDDAEVNPNAIAHAKRSGVYGVCAEIDDAIDSYIEFQKMMEGEDDIDAECDAIESIEKELNPKTEECAPTAEAVRLIQGGDPWKRAVEVKSPLARMLPVQELTTADLTPESYINDVVLDIQMDDDEVLVA